MTANITMQKSLPLSALLLSVPMQAVSSHGHWPPRLPVRLWPGISGTSASMSLPDTSMWETDCKRCLLMDFLRTQVRELQKDVDRLKASVSMRPSLTLCTKRPLASLKRDSQRRYWKTQVLWKGEDGSLSLLATDSMPLLNLQLPSWRTHLNPQHGGEGAHSRGRGGEVMNPQGIGGWVGC